MRRYRRGTDCQGRVAAEVLRGLPGSVGAAAAAARELRGPEPPDAEPINPNTAPPCRDSESWSTLHENGLPIGCAYLGRDVRLCASHSRDGVEAEDVS